MGNKRTRPVVPEIPAAPEPIIRSDNWKLQPGEQQFQWLRLTVNQYQGYVQLLLGVIYTHWPAIAASDTPQAAVEKLVHATHGNPHPRYPLFDKRFPKFPSYLRRAAINFAIGQVSSFVSNYARWQSGRRSRRDARPPQRGNATEANPSLYRGQMIKFDDAYKKAAIKVWDGHDWIWTLMPIVGHRKRHTVSTNKLLSPMLVLSGKRAKLSVPFQIGKVRLGREPDRVCAVDLGINTTAVASIVTEDGTVVARRFIHPAADIDRRDKSLSQIRHKASLTGKLSEGFCKGLYAKGRHRNLQIARDVKRAIIDFARANGTTVIVFERLKHFRPKGGRRRSNLKQRFHGWLHRLLVQLVEMTAKELGWKVAFVNPRGTSKYAFDGSGELRRDADNRAWATFRTGKRYNCDLNASYNIGARYWVTVLVERAGVSEWQQLLQGSHDGNRAGSADCPGVKSPAEGCRMPNGHETRSGRGQRSSKAARRAPRIPVTLSTLWLIARAREGEAAPIAA